MSFLADRSAVSIGLGGIPSLRSGTGGLNPSLDLNFAVSKSLDPRITFTRASEARYYDASTVAVAEQNLFTYSQEFDNAAWTKTRLTLTANATAAPDGSITADLISQTSGQTSSGAVSRSFVGSLDTFAISVFAKKESKNFIVVREDFSAGTAKSTWFNVSTGTVGTTASGHTASITSFGNGWYRCTITFTANAVRTGPVLFYVADSDNSFTVTDSGGIYLWGAQLEQRSTVTAYTPTTTAAITNYIPVLQVAANGVARFDHNPVTRESLGLLIEEQRTNLLTYSEQFDNAAWTKTRATITANTIVSPDGTVDGDKLVEDTSATNSHTLRVSPSLSAVSYTLTVYAKAAERSWIRLVNASVANSGAYFNLTTGVLGTVGASATASIASVGNGWYRCSVTSTAVAGTNSIDIRLASADNSDFYTGDGFSGIYIWGAQLEAGAFATSYIPTVASQVTRSADAASMTGTNFSSWYRQDEGTLFSDFTSNASFASSPRISMTVSDGTTSNRIRSYVNSSATVLQTQLTSAGVSATLSNTVTASVGAVNRLAVAYKVNDFASSANAGVVATATGQVPQNINQAVIGVDLSSTGYINGTIKKIAYYPVRLANATLQSLTA